MTNLTPENIASVIHEANRQLRMILGDPPGPHWSECDQQLKETVVNGVRAAQNGASPEELHEEWVRFKAQQGWTWGPMKDNLRRKHHCMVPYGDLPPDQQMKDRMFYAMVAVLSRDTGYLLRTGLVAETVRASRESIDSELGYDPDKCSAANYGVDIFLETLAGRGVSLTEQNSV